MRPNSLVLSVRVRITMLFKISKTLEDLGPRVTHAHWRHYRPGILSLCSQTRTADLNTPDRNVWSVSNLPAERSRLIAANERARWAGTYLLSESA